jgi:hypothetical protein
LAQAFLAGAWDLEGLIARGGKALGRRYRWLRPLAQRIVASFPETPRPPVARLTKFVQDDPGFCKARSRNKLAFHWIVWPAPTMAPAPGPPQSWPVPSILTPAELANFLDLAPNELDWFADCQGRERTARAERLRHYRYRWITKRFGSLRLIEEPKARLKQLQRRLLEKILLKVPPHDAAHGFRRGRSIKTFVAPHVGRTIVLKMDLRDFFVSIKSARIVGLFLTAGYPESVARLLAGLCTNTVPVEVCKQASRTDDHLASTSASWQNLRPYLRPHLPQGAPTSPALANLAAFRLDARLAGLASAAGASYTRYADDLVFSGGDAFAQTITRFRTHVAAIALEEGFDVQHRKTRVMRQGVRQRAAGVVLNQKMNMTRRDYEELKAVLYNCVRHGPESQNRALATDFRAHLAGRIAHAVQLNPGRGARLARLFEQIAW